MSSAAPLEIIIFVSACFTGALVAGVAGFEHAWNELLAGHGGVAA